MTNCFYKMETEYVIVSKENISILLEFLNLSDSYLDAVLEDSCMIDSNRYEFGNVIVKIPDQMGTYYQTYDNYDEFLKENIVCD